MDRFKLPGFKEVFGSLLESPSDEAELFAAAIATDASGRGGSDDMLQDDRPPKRPRRQQREYHAGLWTQEEHEHYLYGVCKYGHNWKKLAKIVPTRSIRQLKTHAKSAI